MHSKRIIALAAAAALIGPALGIGPAVDLQRRAPNLGWKPPRSTGGGRLSERQRRDPGPLMLRSYAEIPCTAPSGYFWKRDLAGRQNWRLHKAPPQRGRAFYDEIHDRYIIESGWGYLKPRYLSPEQHRAEQQAIAA